MIRTARIVLCVVFMLVAAAGVRAASLDRGLVPADAVRLIYIDAEQWRASPVFQTMWAEHGQDGKHRGKMDNLRQIFGLASWDDLTSVALVSTMHRKGRATMIVHGSEIDRKAQAAYLKQKPNYAWGKQQDRPVQSWTYDTNFRGKQKQHTLQLATLKRGRLIMARNADDFGTAMGVLGGSVPSLTGGGAKLRADVPKGAALFIEFVGGDAEGQHGMHWLRNVDHAVMSVIPSDAAVTMNATVTTPNPEAAMQMQQIIEGFRAMVMLRHGGEQTAAMQATMQAMNIGTEGNRVSVSWSVPNDQIIEMMRRHHGRSKAKGRKARGRDVVDTAINAGSFKTLVAAVKAAGLVETLKGAGPFTVFAPTDEAFAALPDGVLASLLRPENRDKLTAILTYHVVAGRVNSDRVVKKESLATVQGDKLRVKVRWPNISIGKSTIKTADVKASNGVIHVIDKVLIPPSLDLSAAGRAAGAKDVRRIIELAIERGVPLFNNGQPEACAAIYEVAVTSLLDLAPGRLSGKSKAVLRKSLKKAGQQDDASARAWALRRALDEVYVASAGG